MATLLQGSDLVVAAKNIRAELRERFPQTKFGVKSKRFSGGDSITVTWTDGPTTDAVRAVVDRYRDGDFDGMTDSYNYRAGPKPNGSAKYVQCERDYSDVAIERAIAAVAAKWGERQRPTLADYREGRAWSMTPYSDPCDIVSWQQLVNRECAGTTF